MGGATMTLEEITASIAAGIAGLSRRDKRIDRLQMALDEIQALSNEIEIRMIASAALADVDYAPFDSFEDYRKANS
jgi:hypothetical protein